MMPFMYNKVVVFDLDDTLYKEIDYLKSAYREISKYIECIYPQSERNVCELYECLLGLYHSGANVFEELEKSLGINIKKDQLLHIYREHKPNIQLTNGAEELLYVLHRKNIKLGIITDGRSISQRNKINALGLFDFIDDEDIKISQEIGVAKPAPDAYLYFMQHYPNAEYWYIGDNVNKDFFTPNKLGWTTVCLLDNGDNIHKQSNVDIAYRPKISILDLKELINLIDV